MKLKLIFKMFQVIHNDLRALYSAYVSFATVGNSKAEEKRKIYMDSFDSDFNIVKLEIEEEIEKEKNNE